MKRFVCFLTVVLCVTLSMCVVQNADSDKEFSEAPELILENAANGVLYSWTHSTPRADSYKLYWQKGFSTQEAIIEEGTLIKDPERQGVIDGLTDGDLICALLVAVKSGYTNACSVIATRTYRADGGETGGNVFTGAPSLTLTQAVGGISYSWTASNPAAESYDLYWREGTHTSASPIKGGTKIANAVSGGSVSGLTAGTQYSFVVTANKSGFVSIDSLIARAAPLNNEDDPSIVKQGRSEKRGQAVNGFTAADMALVSSTSTWFYNWGNNLDATMNNAAKANELSFVPMIWSGANRRNWVVVNGEHTDDYNDTVNQAGYDQALGRIASYAQNNPGTEYVLAFNEPNLKDQASMTPAQAAADWPKLKTMARNNNLKIVSPAMNYGTFNDYGNPIKWLDEFFGLDGNPGFNDVAIGDIDAVSIHCYMNYPTAIKGFIDFFKKYNKPIWMTEWCAWEGQGGNLANQDVGTKWQMYVLSQTAMIMEQDPLVGRYSWFMLKTASATGHNSYPWWSLVVNQSASRLTDLGLVYTHMSTCDKSVWYPAGQVIPAKNFSANDLSERTDVGASWRDSVTFRPTTDPAAESVLDIHEFKNAMWVEYQIEVPETKNYSITLRYTTPVATTMRVSIDGTQVGSNISLPQNNNWVTGDIIQTSIAKGKHTIRLSVTGGASNCALNWLKAE